MLPGEMASAAEGSVKSSLWITTEVVSDKRLPEGFWQIDVHKGEEHGRGMCGGVCGQHTASQFEQDQRALLPVSSQTVQL